VSERLTSERLAEIRAQAGALRGGWLRFRDEREEWALASIPPLPMVADDMGGLLAHIDAQQAEIDRLTNLARELAVEVAAWDAYCRGDESLEHSRPAALLAKARAAGLLEAT